MNISFITVLIDTRERRPLFFPDRFEWFPVRGGRGTIVRVKSVRKRLSEGDYALKGFEDACLVERKGSMRELQTNLLGDDYTRSEAAFGRLASACRTPYLLLDFGVSEALKNSKYVEYAPTLDALMKLIVRYNLNVLWAGNCKTHQSRRRLGELVLRTLLTYALHGEPQCPRSPNP